MTPYYSRLLQAIRENFAMVEITLPDDTYFVINDRVKITATELVGSLGSILNLWAGITVLFLMELIEVGETQESFLKRIVGRNSSVLFQFSSAQCRHPTLRFTGSFSENFTDYRNKHIGVCFSGDIQDLLPLKNRRRWIQGCSFGCHFSADHQTGSLQYNHQSRRPDPAELSQSSVYINQFWGVPQRHVTERLNWLWGARITKTGLPLYPQSSEKWVGWPFGRCMPLWGEISMSQLGSPDSSWHAPMISGTLLNFAEPCSFWLRPFLLCLLVYNNPTNMQRNCWTSAAPPHNDQGKSNDCHCATSCICLQENSSSCDFYYSSSSSSCKSPLVFCRFEHCLVFCFRAKRTG